MTIYTIGFAIIGTGALFADRRTFTGTAAGLAALFSLIASGVTRSLDFGFSTAEYVLITVLLCVIAAGLCHR